MKTIPASAESVSTESDYTFETVPVENIQISADDGVCEIQPRHSFTMSYEVTPWYTTTPEIYFDVIPQNAATITSVTPVELIEGMAQGEAKITVSPDAVVGSTFR
ncbi:MAG: hypothetical protein K2G96_03960, partial [Clostridia bacterium]|nr:hypothetical protein [Clostridia bacterium]